MKQFRLFSMIAALCLLMAGTTARAQAVGDYGSNGDGNWTANATWVVCVTAGTWVGATSATAGTSNTTNVWIRNGHTVIFDTSSKNCNNLTIESGGKLWANSANTSPKYLNLYGDITNNGVFGGSTDALGVKPYKTLATLSGSGSFGLTRIQPQNASSTIVIDADILANYAGGDGAGGTSVYNNSKDNITYTINAGKTLTLANNSYLSLGTSGSTASSYNLTINVNGSLEASGSNSIINLNATAGKTVNVNIGPSGIINANGPLRATYLNLGTVNINVANGGALNGMTTGSLALSKAALTLNGALNCLSSVNDSLGVSTVGTSGVVSINKTSGVLVLNGAMALDGTLLIMGGKMQLGNNNLTSGQTGQIISTPGNYIVTDGTGVLTLPTIAGDQRYFPVGASTTSFDPVGIKPSADSNFSVRVGTTLSGTPASGYQYNQKEWDITPVTPSATELSFTPSAITATGPYYIIGHFVDGDYVNILSTIQNGPTYTATFSTFSPFVTGTSDTPTALNNAKSGLFVSVNNSNAYLNGAFEGQMINVYGTNGQLVKNLEAKGNLTALQLNKGIYLVKVNNETLKVAL